MNIANKTVLPESAAMGIFDALEKGEEDIFPDPASQLMAEGWHWRSQGARAAVRSVRAGERGECVTAPT